MPDFGESLKGPAIRLFPPLKSKPSIKLKRILLYKEEPVRYSINISKFT